MRVSIPIWIIVCVVFAWIVFLVIMSFPIFTQQAIGRDLNKLRYKLIIGMKSEDVIKELGHPDIVTSLDTDLVPYEVSPKRGEEIMLYGEYPWGILVYVDKKQQRVTRLVLVRHP